jgi:3-hydroxyisobutyrate dehydrogenase
MKLLVNALFGIQVVALGELTGLAARSGLEVTRLLQVLPELAVTSPALKGALGLVSARNFEPLFPLALVEKDFKYAVNQAEGVGALTPLTRQALDVFGRACKEGYGAENITAVTKLFELDGDV